MDYGKIVTNFFNVQTLHPYHSKISSQLVLDLVSYHI
jgi:hypothetical protein